MQPSTYTDPHVAAAQAFIAQDWTGQGLQSSASGTKEIGKGRRVILVHITGLREPNAMPLGGLTIESLHDIFETYGVVDKIVCVTMPKHGTPIQYVDAMVQFNDDAAAATAIKALNSVSLTGDGYNEAQAKYSKHGELTTGANTDRIRDFTTEAKQDSSSASGGRRAVLAHITNLTHPDVEPLGRLTNDALHAAFSCFGVIEHLVCTASPRIGTPVHSVDVTVHYQSAASAASAISTFDKNSITGDDQNIAQMSYARLPAEPVGVDNSVTCRMPGEASPVVQVSNLDDQLVDTDVLFNIFALYGYIVCVKVLPMARHTALVQFTEPGFADLAIRHLSNASLFGRPLQVSRCTDKSINLNDLDTSDCCKSFRGVPQYWPPGAEAKISANACAPSRTVFLKNIPPQISGEEIMALCSQYGTVVNFSFLPRKGDRFITGVVQMLTVEEGMTVVALGQKMHLQSSNGESMRLMASFSKKDQMPASALQGESMEGMTPRSTAAPVATAAVTEANAGPWAATPTKRGAGATFGETHPEQHPKMARHQASASSGNVLIARVTDLQWPEAKPLGGLSIPQLHEAFSSFGTIQKIVCTLTPEYGPPLEYVTCMIQFQTEEASINAAATVDGQSMTGDGYNIIEVSVSHEELYVAENSSLCHNFMAMAPSQEIPAPRAGGGPSGGRRVLLSHITILSRPMEAPLGGLTLEVLHAVFGQCGLVEKIVCSTMPKTGAPVQYVDAMVQFDTASAAAGALGMLDGVSLTADGYNHAQIKYSKHDELRADGPVDKMRDFTLESGYVTQRQVKEDPVVAAALALLSGAVAKHQLQPAADTGRRIVLAHITSLIQPDEGPLGGLSIDSLHDIFSPYGIVKKMVCSTMPKNGTPIQYVDVMVQYDSSNGAHSAIAALDKRSITGDGFNQAQLKYSKHVELHTQANNDRSRDFTTGEYAGGFSENNGYSIGNSFGSANTFSDVLKNGTQGTDASLALQGGMSNMNGASGMEDTPVAIVFNLNEEAVDVDVIFNLFNIYGYVEVVKIVYNRRHTAMVQFSQSPCVDIAIKSLSGTMLFGKMIQVSRSKQPSIRCSERDNTSAERTTRSFLGQVQFWPQDAIELVNLYACSPCESLYVKNIAPQITEKEIAEVCSKFGAVVSFSFLPLGEGEVHRSGTLFAGSPDDAVNIVAQAQRHVFKTLAGEEVPMMMGFWRQDGS